MKRTLLGFATVICAALAVLPMLVETDQLSARDASTPQPALQGLQIAGIR